MCVRAPLKSCWFGAHVPRPRQRAHLAHLKPRQKALRRASAQASQSVTPSVHIAWNPACELRPSTPSLAATTTFRLITTALILSSYAYRRFLFDCASTLPRQTSFCSPSTRILRRLARSRPPTAARTTSIHQTSQPASHRCIRALRIVYSATVHRPISLVRWIGLRRRLVLRLRAELTILMGGA